jgi:hypothetical protein
MTVRVLLVAALVALYGCGQASSPVEKQEEAKDADQAQLDPIPENPTLESATFYITGSNGGPYKVSWTVWTAKYRVQKHGREAGAKKVVKDQVLREGRATGIIKDEPTAYPINLEGFKSDLNDVFFLGYEDLEMRATKLEPWEGRLVLVLEVNDVLVACDTMRETASRGGYHEVAIEFDADLRKDYKEQRGCANSLGS